MNFLALSGKETGCGKEILQTTREKVARKAGYQYPIQNRKVMTTQPRSDDSGDKVVPRGVIIMFTTKKHMDTQLLDRLPPNTEIWTYPFSACI